MLTLPWTTVGETFASIERISIEVRPPALVVELPHVDNGRHGRVSLRKVSS